MNPRLHCTPVFWVEEDLRKLRHFHSLMEEAVTRVYQDSATRLNDLVERGIASIGDGVLERLTQECPRDSDANDLPKKLRYSIVIHLFTTIETQASTLCDEVADVVPMEPRISLSDLKGTKLERTRKYLDKVCGVFAANRPEWERIDWIEKLRHVIVHQGGEAPREPEGRFLRELAKRNIGLTIDNAQQLFLSRALCTELIEGAETFFAQAYAAAGLSYEPWKDETMKQ